MGAPSRTPARIIAERAMERFHEAMKPLLSAAGVRAVERRIGRPERFFQKTRERDALRLSDYVATCAVLDRDPAELLAEALNSDAAPETRPPRIVAVAWKAIKSPGEGIGAERLAELEAMVQSEPGKKTRRVLKRELDRASREEVPKILGYYGSSLRIETDLTRAEYVLKEGREIALAVDAPKVEAEILIRMGYIALEQHRLSRAVDYAMAATLGYARLGDAEGEGRGFMETGMFRYYSRDYRQAVWDLEGSLARPLTPRYRFSAHQVAGLCWLALSRENKAHEQIAAARDLAPYVPPWLVAKLDWLESRVVAGPTRIELLQAARAGLCPSRPADCALVTVELIEEAFAAGRQDLVEQETKGLGQLIFRNPSSRIAEALLKLTGHRSPLNPVLIAEVRRALHEMIDRRLSQLAGAEQLPPARRRKPHP